MLPSVMLHEQSGRAVTTWYSMQMGNKLQGGTTAITWTSRHQAPCTNQGSRSGCLHVGGCSTRAMQQQCPCNWQPLGLNKMSHHAQSKHATQQGHGQPTSLGAAATPLQPVLSRRICTHVQRTTCPSPCMQAQPQPWHKLPQHCSTRCTGAAPQAPQPPPSAAIWAYIL